MTNIQVMAILPKQYAGTWTSPEGTRFKIFSYVDLTTKTLEKIFMPTLDFVALEIKNHFGKNVLLETNEDSEGRTVIVSLSENE